METNLWTGIAVTGFVWTIATRQLVMEGVWVVGQQNADIADTLQVRDIVMATIFVFLYMGCTLARWRHLSNTTEPSVCGSNAALCEINLTTCLHSLPFYPIPKILKHLSIGQTPLKVPLLLEASTFPCNTCSLDPSNSAFQTYLNWFSHFRTAHGWLRESLCFTMCVNYALTHDFKKINATINMILKHYYFTAPVFCVKIIGN